MIGNIRGLRKQWDDGGFEEVEVVLIIQRPTRPERPFKREMGVWMNEEMKKEAEALNKKEEEEYKKRLASYDKRITTYENLRLGAVEVNQK